MHGVVDGECLGDSILVLRIQVVPARFSLNKIQPIRTVTIDLVCRQVDKRSLRARSPGCFQQIQGATSVDVKIIKRPGGGQIMAGLGRGVDDCVRSDFADEFQDSRPVAYIDLVVAKTGKLSLEALPVPGCVSLGTEKIAAHVVVNTADSPPPTAEICHDLATNEAA